MPETFDFATEASDLLDRAMRAFAEWASDENLALARKGMREARDTPFHDLDATAIAEGSAAFTTIKEWFDAR